MKAFAKTYIKQRLPRLALRLRVQKIINRRIDPDLYFLANFRKCLSESRYGKKFFYYFSKENTAVDVGACSGEYSYILAKNFQQVLSVEPIPEMTKILTRSLPSNCEIIECALGENVGEVCLRIPMIADQKIDALATIADHNFDFSNIEEISICMVKQFTVDKLIDERNLKPSFIKIDVEGYEMNVLRGSMKVIERHKPIFFIEIEKRHNKRFQEIFSLLNLQGYVPYHFRNGELCMSNPQLVDKSYEYLLDSGNSGIGGIINSRISENYINNFVFLPVC